jgi:hypothetical protein
VINQCQMARCERRSGLARRCRFGSRRGDRGGAGGGERHAGGRAYVGSAISGITGRYGQNDMVRAIRSPGSTLKPFITA